MESKPTDLGLQDLRLICAMHAVSGVIYRISRHEIKLMTKLFILSACRPLRKHRPGLLPPRPTHFHRFCVLMDVEMQN
jgi:hypothetical protein